jgi:adenylate cyclase
MPAKSGTEALLFHEAWRSERAINVFRSLFWTAICLAILLGEEQSKVFIPAIMLGLAYGVLCGLISLTWLRKRYHAAFAYVVTLFDFVLLLFIHEQTHIFLLASSSPDAKSQLHAVVPALMLVISVNVLRFSWQTTAVAVVAASVGYLNLALRYESVNRTTTFVNTAIIVLFGGFLLYASVLLRRIIHRVKERDAFARFLPGPVVDRLTADPTAIDLGGERQEATVLFSDIRGFTTMAEGLEPEVVVSLLNEYFQEMVEEIFDNQGILDKFIGDGICAVFGPPLSGVDQASRAVRAAKGMLVRLDAINEKRGKRGEPKFKIGIGIHTGQLVAGNIGSPRRLEYTHVGDTVNTASRIEGLTKTHGAPLLISGATYARLNDGEFDTKQIGSETLRGRPEPIDLYAVR